MGLLLNLKNKKVNSIMKVFKNILSYFGMENKLPVEDTAKDPFAQMLPFLMGSSGMGMPRENGKRIEYKKLIDTFISEKEFDNYCVNKFSEFRKNAQAVGHFGYPFSQILCTLTNVDLFVTFAKANVKNLGLSSKTEQLHRDIKVLIRRFDVMNGKILGDYICDLPSPIDPATASNKLIQVASEIASPGTLMVDTELSQWLKEAETKIAQIVRVLKVHIEKSNVDQSNDLIGLLHMSLTSPSVKFYGSFGEE